MIYFFWKHDCEPCRKTKPMIGFIEAEFNVDVTWVNAAENPELAEQLRVTTVPAVVITKPDGTRYAGFTGNLISPGAVLRAANLAEGLVRNST